MPLVALGLLVSNTITASFPFELVALLGTLVVETITPASANAFENLVSNGHTNALSLVVVIVVGMAASL